MFGLLILLELVLFGLVLYAVRHEDYLIGVEERFVAVLKERWRVWRSRG